MIALEASDRELLPGWSHPGISRERVAGVWKAGVADDGRGGRRAMAVETSAGAGVTEHMGSR